MEPTWDCVYVTLVLFGPLVELKVGAETVSDTFAGIWHPITHTSYWIALPSLNTRGGA